MFRNLPRRLGAAILAAVLSHAPAWAQDVAAQHGRLDQLREFSYLAPSHTLAELRKLKPQVGQWPQRDQAAYYSLLSNVLRGTDSGAALQAAETEERIGRQLGDESIVANSLLDRAYVKSVQGEDEAATLALAMAHQMAQQTKDLAMQAKTTITSGQDAIRQGNGRKGLEHMDRAVTLANASNQPVIQFMALRARALALSGLAGEGQQALKAVDALKAKAAAIPLDGIAIRASYTEWQIADEAGQLARARSALAEVVAWLQKHRMNEMVPRLQVSLADFSLRSQDYKEALRLSRESKQAGHAAGDTLAIETSQFNEGIALIYLGQLEEGRSIVEAANFDYIDAEALLEYARALDYVGQKEFALKVFARASRKLQDDTSAEAQLQKKNRENEELLRQKDDKAKDLRNAENVQRIWSMVAAVGVLVLLVLAFLSRKLWLANLKLKGDRP
ncbi:hypothetical protein [Pseudoduganella sp. OTU4001]|uniref:hypothetical protein n=1 Tax=Pseudoduganella sp. OTU4001 TaxID=3043854 RepID=UPI00313DC4A3